MKSGLTKLVLILDRSGSMQAIRDDAIGGYNNFLDEQSKVPGDASVTLVQFDDQYELVYKNMPIKQAPKLSYETFAPRGTTALLDAFGRTIDEVGKELSALDDNQRPERVIVCMVTDGQENASKKYSCKQIAEMVEHQRTKYNWGFLFIGANMDAIAEASKLGINKLQSITYRANSVGTKAVYDSMSDVVSAMRCCSTQDMNAVAFSEEDREKQKELLNK